MRTFAAMLSANIATLSVTGEACAKWGIPPGPNAPRFRERRSSEACKGGQKSDKVVDSDHGYCDFLRRRSVV